MTDAASESRRKFLVVADDSPEFAAALKYAARVRPVVTWRC
jgi:hypothetical protein